MEQDKRKRVLQLLLAALLLVVAGASVRFSGTFFVNLWRNIIFSFSAMSKDLFCFIGMIVAAAGLVINKNKVIVSGFGIALFGFLPYLIKYNIRTSLYTLIPVIYYLGFFIMVLTNKRKIGVVSLVAAIANIVYQLSMFESFPWGNWVECAAKIIVSILMLCVINGPDNSYAGDNVSEAAKEKLQTKRQKSLYDEQLRDGIITQEEYEQLKKGAKG